jgi:hypothetical protein
MGRGYQRREAERAKPLRLIATILLNVNRGERDAAVTPEEVMYLYGDVPPAPPEILSEDEFDRIAAAYS